LQSILHVFASSHGRMVVILKVNLHSGTVSRVKRFFDTQAASLSPRAVLKAHYLHGRFGHLKLQFQIGQRDAERLEIAARQAPAGSNQ